MTVDEALQALLGLQQRALAFFVERRNERQPLQPTRMQTFVLRTILERGPLSVSQLSEALNVSASTTSQLITALVDRGWVKMEISPRDRRRHQVELTDLGRVVLGEHLKNRLTHVKTVLEKLTPEERRTLVTLLDRVVTLWHEGSPNHGHGKEPGCPSD
ncbi:MAG: MarR family transcriptional regulator [Firmicutes bacterium]|nr:MarR family transcriptional regulator [Bacillota bacterium]